MYKTGDDVVVLEEYNLYPGRVISVGPKRIKVLVDRRAASFMRSGVKYFLPEKVARADEMICVVWEAWKGRNGRGGYRLDRGTSPHELTLASEYLFQHRVTENTPPRPQA